MEAVRLHKIGGPEALVYERLPTPEPTKGEIRIKVESISVNFSDSLIRRGKYPYMPDFPAILGAECAGKVESIGQGVKGFYEGQKVLVFGRPSYTTHLTIEAKRAIPLPSHVDLDEAAALPVAFLTAYHLLHTVRRVQPGETVLIYAAAGGVGLAVIQLAKLAGVRTIGLTSKANKVKFLEEQGCDHVLNYKEENIVGRVMALTEGRGADLILDSVAGDGFEDNFNMLNTLGQIIWFGIAAGLPKVDLLSILACNPAQSHAVSIFHLFSIMQNPVLLRGSMNHLIDLFAAGKIKPVIYDRLPLKDAAKAHSILEEGENIGRIILKP